MAIESSMGHQSTLSIGGTSYPVISETLSKKQSHNERMGLRGTRSHDVDDVADGINTIDGTIVIEPTNSELTALLSYIMGPATTLNETLTAFTVIVGRDYDVFTYTGCKVSRASFSGRTGENLRLSLDVVGLAGTNTGSAPSEPTSALPFIFSDVTLTLQSAARQVDEFDVVIDNYCVPKYRNNRDPVEIVEGDRTVTVRTVHPYSSNSTGLYNQARAGAAGTLVLSGAGSRTFTFAKLQVPAEDPTVGGKGEIPLTLNMTARKDGATAELVVS